MKGPLFYSKILLFGEYGIIKDSKGLSIPYNFYNGALIMEKSDDDSARKSNESLCKFADYLDSLQNEQPNLVSFDIDRLNSDVAAGMFFDSSIPQGYGVGSSGALVAAIYDKYAYNKITVLENLTREKLLTLKVFLARWNHSFMETIRSCPLNSYLSLPILITSQDHLEILQVFPRKKPEAKGAVFLLDSGMTGETAPMASYFYGKSETRKVL